MDKPQILWVSRVDVLPGAGVKNHSHPYFHMFYIAAGQCRMVTGSEVHMLCPGHCLLVPCHQEHAYSNEGDAPIDFLEIKFSLPHTAADTQLLNRGVQVSDSPLVGMLFEQVLKEYSTLGSLADESAAAYLSALLHALGETERGQKQPFRYVDTSACSELTQQVVRYLEEHYAEEVSLDLLAAAMGYNKSYLCVAFKKNTRTTILDCLNMIRIRRAAELLVYSEHSLTQVAELCGFASASHFNRVFLKYVGITPGQCRRAYPANILFGPEPLDTSTPTNAFMYSVLARTTITPEMIGALDLLEKGESKEG